MDFQGLLDALGYTADEFVSVCWQVPGGQFRSAVVQASDAVKKAEAIGAGSNIWFGVNPTAGPVRESAGRGSESDTTRVSSLFADLDVKDGACNDLPHARRIIAALSGKLGTPPTRIVRSGNGLQPYWPIEDGGPLTDEGRARAKALVTRWGRLVKQTCEEHGAGVDNVHELARVLRVPGTFNVKDADNPKPVVAEQAPGAPLTVAEINDRLNEFSVAEAAGDERITGGGPVVASPDTWVHATDPCKYATDTINGWRNDIPDIGRHPWLLAQAVRLTAMHRRGCLTEALHRRGYDIIAARFTELCEGGIGGPPREVKPREVEPEAWQFGVCEVSRMTDEEVDNELGSHPHWTDMVAGQEIVVAEIVDGSPPGDQPPPPPPGGGDGGQPGGGGGQQITLTDSGNAEMMAARHGGHLRYCPDMGKWLSWDGSRWVMRPDDSEAYQAAKQTIDAIQHNGDQRIARHILQSLSANKLSAMVGLARRTRAMQVHVDQLDADGYSLNTPDGIVDLRTGNLLLPDPNAWHTKRTGVGYDTAGGRPDGWLRFLDTTFGGDVELISYMQRLAGYAAMGVVSHHVLPFLLGAGQNGKTVFLEVLEMALGDYAIAAPATFLLERRSEQHETEIARLRGARMVICSEIDQGSKFAEAKVKLLTGGDRLTARFMRQDHFDFTPSHTLFLMGNHQPTVEAGGPSFWRRLRLIPFMNRVPDSQKVSGLQQMLVRDEGPQILAWIVQGAVDVSRLGSLVDPPAVLQATEEYATEEDTLGRFVDECLKFGGGDYSRTQAAMLSNTYTRWCRQNGEEELPTRVINRELSARLRVRKAEPVKSNGVRQWKNVEIAENWVPSWLMGDR